MKVWLFGLLALSIFAASEEFWGVPEEDEVAILNTKNFDDFLKKNKYVFVKFYAPWCGHCKSMAPAYSKLAKRYKEQATPIPIAKVDATVESELATKFGIKGFPTLKFFIDGEAIDYSGPREENDIFQWIEKKTGPAAKEVESTEELDRLLKENLTVLLVLPKSDAESLKKYQAIAANFEGVSFHYSFDKAHAEKFSTHDAYTLAVIRAFDDGTKVLAKSSLPPSDEIKEFITKYKFPLVMEFNQAAAERIFGSEQPAVIFFSEDHNSSQAAAFKEVAKKRGSEILFSISKIKSDLGARLSEFIGVTAADENSVRIIKFVGGNLQKFKCTVAETEKCLDDYKDNKLTAYYKSEAIPESNSEPVKVIVGNNFKELVIDSDKHVLLEAYAPWCGHCKKLAPIYEELGKKLQGSKDIVIAKMDGSANEYPGFDIQGFPTIKFYKKGSKSSPIDFSGDRTLEGFIKFLEKETGVTIDDGAKPTEGEL